MNDISLETFLNIIELCKYSEVDGEKAELIIAPANNNGRSIRIGINGAFSREYFEYTYPDGNEFDKSILPVIVNEFLKDDNISSWVTKDPQLEEFPVKELIVTEKENEILIQTFDKNIHEYIKDNTESIQLNNEKEELTENEKAVEKILKYLKEKNKVRVELAKYNNVQKKELISIIEKAYQLNKGRTLTDEQIYNFADNIHEGISKECYEAIVNDIRNNNSRLINEIRDYLRNEHKYENYLDEEPYISLNEVGNILVEKGYFELRYAFPQKTDLYNLTGDKLKDIVTSRYKSKYKLLAETKQEFEKDDNEENDKYTKILDTYMGYLVKTTRAKIGRKSEGKAQFKENVQNYKNDDFKTLMDAVKLYKGGKLDTERLEIVITEYEETYGVNVRLSNGVARDNNVFNFSKTDIFLTEVIPKLLDEIKKDDDFAKKRENVDTTVLTTGKGNEVFIDSHLLKNVKLDIKEDKEEKASMDSLKEDDSEEFELVEDLADDKKYLSSYFRKLVLKESGKLLPTGIREIKDLEAKSADVRNLEKARKKFEDGFMSEEKYDKLVLHYRSLLSKYVDRGLKRNPIKRTNQVKEENEFSFLHKILKRYKVQNVDGEIRTYNRTLDTEVTFNNPDDLFAVEFASYWCSAAGIKSIDDNDILGETYAFGNDCGELFNIINSNFNNNKLDLDAIKTQFEQSTVENNMVIYDRLFKDQDHIMFVTKGLQEFNRVFKDKKIDAKEENIDVKEIVDEYDRLDKLSNEDITANLIISYSDDYVTLKTECEQNDKTTVTLIKKYKTDYFNENILESVVRKYIEIDEIYKSKPIINEDTGKHCLIAIGKNNNVLQIRDIDNTNFEKLEEIIENYDNLNSKKHER